MTNGTKATRAEWPVGLRITRARAMTRAEIAGNAWNGEEPGVVLVLEDGSTLYAARDPEGNGPGALLFTRRDGSGALYVQPEGEKCDGCGRDFPRGTLARDTVDAALLYCGGCRARKGGA